MGRLYDKREEARPGGFVLALRAVLARGRNQARKFLLKPASLDFEVVMSLFGT